MAEVMSKRCFHAENTTPSGDWIYVFAAEAGGRHAHGYAKIAKVNFGARYGTSKGLCGKSYALELWDRRGVSHGPEVLLGELGALGELARANPKKRYFLTSFDPVEHGLIGADAFGRALKKLPENVSLPQIWAGWAQG